MPDTDKSSIEHRSVLVNKNSMGERRDRTRSSSSEDANPKTREGAKNNGKQDQTED